MKNNIKLYNGLELPSNGFGTFLLDGQEAYESVLNAIKSGYRLIDTAAVYNNEEEVGKAIKDSKINRNDVYISSKLLAKKKGYNVAIEECKKSLLRLQVEYLDVYFIHWMPKTYEELLETWRGLEYLYKNGYCKAIGICNVTLFYLDRLLKECEIKPMLCQIECHPFLQQNIFIDYCFENDIKVISYGMFAKGLVFKNERLELLAKENKTSVANLILSWGQTRGLITLSKSSTARRIEANFKNNFILKNELLDEINELNDGLRVYRDPENNPYA